MEFKKSYKGHTIKAKVSAEQIVDLSSQYGIDVSAMIEKILVEELKQVRSTALLAVDQIAKDPCLRDSEIDIDQLLDRMMEELKCDTYEQFHEALEKGISWSSLNTGI